VFSPFILRKATQEGILFLSVLLPHNHPLIQINNLAKKHTYLVRQSEKNIRALCNKRYSAYHKNLQADLEENLQLYERVFYSALRYFNENLWYEDIHDNHEWLQKTADGFRKLRNEFIVTNGLILTPLHQRDILTTSPTCSTARSISFCKSREERLKSSRT
jgi:hypothetical protein